MITLALGALAAWLATLSLVIVLLVRQVSLLSVRVTLASSTFTTSLDGPELGTEVSDSVARAFGELDQAVVLALSGDCNAFPANSLRTWSTARCGLASSPFSLATPKARSCSRIFFQPALHRSWSPMQVSFSKSSASEAVHLRSSSTDE